MGCKRDKEIPCMKRIYANYIHKGLEIKVENKKNILQSMH